MRCAARRKAAERGARRRLIRRRRTQTWPTARPATPPADATADRGAQDHEQADIETGGEAQPGLYPADAIANREGDNTPGAPDPHVDWDTRVQPERPDEHESGADDIETEGT